MRLFCKRLLHLLAIPDQAVEFGDLSLFPLVQSIWTQILQPRPQLFGLLAKPEDRDLERAQQITGWVLGIHGLRICHDNLSWK
jgi:hypothetical protein